MGFWDAVYWRLSLPFWVTYHELKERGRAFRALCILSVVMPVIEDARNLMSIRRMYRVLADPSVMTALVWAVALEAVRDLVKYSLAEVRREIKRERERLNEYVR